MRWRVILFVVLLALIPPVGPVSASDGCGFGKEYIGDGSETCVGNLWKLGKSNDGFVKYVSVTLNPDTDLSNNAELFNTLHIKCEKKKIHIYIFMVTLTVQALT
jgi:hypothetical protein